MNCRFAGKCSVNNAWSRPGNRRSETCRLPGPIGQRIYVQGEYLYHEEDCCAGLFLLFDGAVAIERVSETGRPAILKLVWPGETFSYGDLIAGNHGSTARAVVESLACLIPRGLALGGGDRQAGLSRMLADGCGRESRAAEAVLFERATHSLAQRLTRLLRKLGGQPEPGAPVIFELPIRKHDIAALLGCDPAVLSRAFRRLADEGIAVVHGNRVRLAACQPPPTFHPLAIPTRPTIPSAMPEP